MFPDPDKAIIQKLESPLYNEKQVELFVKREDLIHPYISGNKWRKLKYNVQVFQQSGKRIMVSFGGAFSNHIHALACTGDLLGIPTAGIIRGELKEPLNPTLREVLSWGMQLKFLSREEYKKKELLNISAVTGYSDSEMYIIPEGGANEAGVKGCAEILDNVRLPFDYLCCACGTGTTLLGLGAALKGKRAEILAFPAIKGALSLEAQLKEKLKEGNRMKFFHEFHFGGYGKVKPELLRFMHDFEEKTHIPLDPLYTGKMFYGIHQLIQEDYFPKGSVILTIHTGGLQGKRGFKEFNPSID